MGHHSGCGVLWHRGLVSHARDVACLGADLLPYSVGDHDDASPLLGLHLRRPPAPQLHWRPGLVVDQVDLAVARLHGGIVEVPLCQEGALAEILRSSSLQRHEGNFVIDRPSNNAERAYDASTPSYEYDFLGAPQVDLMNCHSFSLRCSVCNSSHPGSEFIAFGAAVPPD